MPKSVAGKYRPFPPINLAERTWPNRTIEVAPEWCSVDLRDGNQALIIPMDINKKLDMFQLLLEMGFKQIETGFPSASEVEFEFNRHIIDKKLIPEDVAIQVLTQSREKLIRKTFESLAGARRAIIHLYNSTSELQRRVVFNKSRSEIIEIAVSGVKLIKSLLSESDTEITLEYSPESFSATEIDFALEICQAVMEEWEPTTENKIILNLPATVEMSTPNIYADQIEWFINNLPEREKAIISIHTHNDRGTAVAASELALMAGGQRIEGTLFGNGERTGNVDIVTMAMNLFTQGVDPGLDLSNINNVREIYERVTHLPVHYRHPYAGELVYTAFSGSHQDAINKGMSAYQKKKGAWEVPYLPIDPEDVGRDYEAVIRINSQSGKGGVAYIMEQFFGYQLPKKMQPEFAMVIQQITDQTGRELQPAEIESAFSSEYLSREEPLQFVAFESIHRSQGKTECTLILEHNGQKQKLQGSGNGPLDACKSALINLIEIPFVLTDYHEHSLGSGSDARAAAYILLESHGADYWGVGVDNDITIASIRALFCALNRLNKTGN